MSTLIVMDAHTCIYIYIYIYISHTNLEQERDPGRKRGDSFHAHPTLQQLLGEQRPRTMTRSVGKILFQVKTHPSCYTINKEYYSDSDGTVIIFTHVVFQSRGNKHSSVRKNKDRICVVPPLLRHIGGPISKRESMSNTCQAECCIQNRQQIIPKAQR
jgi:hypothetical protein